MMKTSKKAITRLLRDYQEGDREAMNELFELVYSDLHQIARRQVRNWKGNHTLNTTDLLHEAYLKLIDHSDPNWKSRSHFFATASRAMRHILINYARDRKRVKRGGNLQRISIEKLKLAVSGEIRFSDERIEMLITLGEAMGKLDKISPRGSRVVECRFFGGMTIKETAEALEISPATVSRSWKMAQLWLYREMENNLKINEDFNLI